MLSETLRVIEISLYFVNVSILMLARSLIPNEILLVLQKAEPEWSKMMQTAEKLPAK